MSRAPITHGPMLDADEAKLRQLDSLIAQTREAECLEAARKAEQERQRAEREAARGSYTLEDLERARDALAGQIAARQHHLHIQDERDVLRRRLDSLSNEIRRLAERTALLQAEQLDVIALQAKLGPATLSAPVTEEPM